MSNVAHTDKNGFDLDEQGCVIATRLSMEHYAAQEHAGRLVAWSPEMQEAFLVDAAEQLPVRIEA